MRKGIAITDVSPADNTQEQRGLNVSGGQRVALLL